jgi:starch-binding outer membrane protein SusE/F
MKKTSLSLLLSGVFSMTLLTQCDKDERDINLNLSEVTNFFTPVDNRSIKVEVANVNTIETFEWEQARAEDGSVVMYEVAFDQENGDFSKPFYKKVSDGGGLNNKLTLTYGDLSQIAKLGGVDFFEKKKFRWTVLASKGTNVKKASVSRVIEIERPNGVDPLPNELFITGTATEGGAAIGSAVRMKRLSNGVFEVYTKLKAGTYKFVDGKDNSARAFHILDDGSKAITDDPGENTFTGPDKIQRITLDFNIMSTKTAEIKTISLWFSPDDRFWFDMDYAGNGIWRKDNQIAALKQEGWGVDTRYKYRMMYNDGTGPDKEQWLNYSSADSHEPTHPHDVDYRKINFAPNDGTRWGWAFKMDRNYLKIGDRADWWVDFSGTTDQPYQVYYEKR